MSMTNSDTNLWHRRAFPLTQSAGKALARSVRRRLLVPLTAVLLLLVTPAILAYEEASQENGRIIVGTECDYPPLSYAKIRTSFISTSYVNFLNDNRDLTLPSRSDQQLVTIATVTVSAEFTLVATSLLSDYVYLQPEMVNNSNTIFLPGNAGMFRNGEFVGKGDLPLVTAGEKLTCGFGIDSQVRVSRELAEKTSRVQGGNRIDIYEYSIALSNYKSKSVGLRLFDRLPYSDDSAINIELTDINVPVSENDNYLRNQRKNGILRWDLQLEPNTIENSATFVTYGITMEYDKNLSIMAANSH